MIATCQSYLCCQKQQCKILPASSCTYCPLWLSKHCIQPPTSLVMACEGLLGQILKKSLIAQHKTKVNTVVLVVTRPGLLTRFTSLSHQPLSPVDKFQSIVYCSEVKSLLLEYTSYFSGLAVYHYDLLTR